MLTEDARNADVVIVIEGGVPRVVKHRTLPEGEIAVEVTLTYTPKPVVEKYPAPQPSLHLADIVRQVNERGDCKVSVTWSAKLAHLREAIRNGTDVLISGTKVDGGGYYQRRVLPIGLHASLLRVFDRDSDERRGFRLDGITRVEDPA